MSYQLTRSLFETGNLKSIFVHSDYATPEEMKEDFVKFAKARNFVEPSIERTEEERWLMKLTEIVEVKEPTPAKIPYHYSFFIIPHWGFWEFYTNVRRRVVQRVIEGLIQFTPKLEHKFVPPNRLISLVKEYESDEMLAFAAKRDYFALTRSSEFKIISDEVSLRLSSTPEKIWSHYGRLVEEEVIGPLAIGAAQLRIISGQKTCNLWVRTSGQIYQTAGSKELFHDIRQRLIRIMEKQTEWAQYFPLAEAQEVEEKGVTIRGAKLVQRGRPFVIKLSKPFEEREYDKLKGIFVFNAKRSGFIGTIEDEVKKASFIVRATDTRGGGDAIITAKVGGDNIVIDPLPSTTVRCLEKIYRVIIEKFDTKALLIEPQIG